MQGVIRCHLHPALHVPHFRLLQLGVYHRHAGWGKARATPILAQMCVASARRDGGAPPSRALSTELNQSAAALSTSSGSRAPHDPYAAPVMLFVGFSAEEVAVLQDSFVEDTTMGMSNKMAKNGSKAGAYVLQYRNHRYHNLNIECDDCLLSIQRACSCSACTAIAIACPCASS